MICEKKCSERRKHCMLAVVRWSQNFHPATDLLPRGAGRPKFNQLEMLNKLQSVQNTLARVVTRSDARTSAAPLLVILHWLPIRHRMYKLATLTFRIRTTSTPQYLSSLFRSQKHWLLASVNWSPTELMSVWVITWLKTAEQDFNNFIGRMSSGDDFAVIEFISLLTSSSLTLPKVQQVGPWLRLTWKTIWGKCCSAMSMACLVFSSLLWK